MNSDTLDELDETFTVTLSDPSNATIADGIGLGTILDDDAPPVLSVNDVTVTEGDSGTVNAVFTVTLAPVSGRAVSVDWATAAGTAGSPADFEPAGGPLTFAAGEATKQVSVTVNSDLLDEVNETFLVNLSNATNATIGDGQGLGTITDNDPLPTLAVDDVTVTELDSGTVNATFTVSLNAPSGRLVTVNFATANGSASAADYDPVIGALSFEPGQTTKAIPVVVHSDVLDEANETFFLNLAGPTNATLADSQGLGTINDNDPTPTLSVNDATVIEGNTGTVPATFTVTLSAPSGRSVTVDYATANGTAIAPGDYAATSGPLTFAAGETTKTVTVQVSGDVLNEAATESFFLNLSNATNATLTDAQGLGTITEDDGTPEISINDAAVSENNASGANFTVSLSAPSGQTVTVDYATANGSATAPADYTAGTGTLTFNPGQTSKQVNVLVVNDLLDEIDETFNVNLSNPQQATIADAQAVGTINDNDPTPALSVDDVTIDEGNAAPTAVATFTVTLNAASGRDVTVDYATANGTATAPADYTATNGTLTFTPGQTTKTVSVTVNGDQFDEANETYFLNLSNAVNATFTDAQGLGTITDDDPLPALSIDNITVLEGDPASATESVPATFTVTLSPASGRAVSVAYATANNTATAPGDYLAASGTLTFLAGETTKTITVMVNGDELNELNETYFVNLTSPTNATLADGQGLGTITDDDGTPEISIIDHIVSEGVSNGLATFTVNLTAASGQTVTVEYATENGSAIAPGDYQTTNGTLTFSPGQIFKTFTVAIVNDSLDEIDETFLVNLSAPQNATIMDGQAVGTITDNDPLPTLAVDDVTVLEGDSGTADATVTVSLNVASGRSVSVNYATANGSATAPGDYGPERHAHVRGRRDVEVGHPVGQRRPDRRGERDLRRQPLEPDERDVPRQPGGRDDHGR